MTTLVSVGLSFPSGVAVDGVRNVCFSDSQNNAIKELPNAFVDPTARLEGLAAGSDSLPVVLPATANLLPPFAPTSDQPWLTITGVASGVVSFSFTANTGPSRTANISLLVNLFRSRKWVPPMPTANSNGYKTGGLKRVYSSRIFHEVLFLLPGPFS